MTRQATPATRYPRDSVEFNRFVSFVDNGTVVALTLLGVSVLPSSRGLSDAEWQRVFDGILRGTNASFVALVVAFVIVASFWLDQHRLYAHLAWIDRPFIIANMVFLFLLTLAPAAALALAEHPRDSSAVAFFTVWVLAFTLVSLWLPWLAARRGQVVPTMPGYAVVRDQLPVSIVRALVLLVAILAVRYLHPWTSFVVLIPGLLLSERLRSRSAAPQD